MVAKVLGKVLARQVRTGERASNDAAGLDEFRMQELKASIKRFLYVGLEGGRRGIEDLFSAVTVSDDVQETQPLAGFGSKRMCRVNSSIASLVS